ncbi:MAG: insulinase family protein, partial [Gammaproteobacteria bacterium]|nr:insulinase family protein [Gammaproteobacteria bacterium]
MQTSLPKFTLMFGLLAAFQVSTAAEQTMLDNGMKVIVEVDDRAPVVVHQVWYKVGSISEHDGITGISHVLEHMMFKGTEKHKAGEFSEIVAQNGGNDNAFTSKEYTSYYQQIAADRLELMMELEADRMRHLRLDEEEFKREVQVVKEERRTRTEDNPRALLYEHFLATAYLSSPDRLPVIGWPADLDELQLADLQDWYEQ